jgi:DNA-binding CsgD family transcriptional regulator
LRDGAYVPVEPGIRALLEYSVARFGMVYGFTSREMDVFGKLLQGRSVKKIAEELGISENTVVSHVRHMYHKTDCHSRQELIDLYMQEEPRE